MTPWKLSRPLIFSFDLRVDGLQFYETDKFLSYFGQNVGNLAFAYAVSNDIIGEKTYSAAANLPVSRFHEKYDCLVFPAANNIGEKSDMRWLADILDKCQLPILIIGLGVQAYFGSTDLALPDGTRRFLDILKERGTRIGVRGKFTQEFLGRYGVNTEVIGCPSFFINRNNALGQQLQLRYEVLRDFPALSLGLNLEYFRLDKERVHVLTRWLSEIGGGLILQSDETVFRIRRGDYHGQPGSLVWIAKYFINSSDVKALEEWLRQLGHIFFHVPSWMDYLRTLSLCVGSRFHGNMLAMQVGTPSVVFPHDTRTLEMCETMAVPHFMWERIDQNTALHDVMQEIRFSGAEFDRRRADLARKYVALIDGVGLDVAPGLRNMTTDGPSEAPGGA